MQQNPPVVKKHQTYDGLDLMKAMAIYFVLIYHFPIMEVDFIGTGKTGAYSNFFIFSIFSTCVPIFFFINGALLFNKSGLIFSLSKINFLSSEYKGHSSIKCISSSTALLPSIIILQHLQILLERERFLSASTFKLCARRSSLVMHLITALLFNILIY